MKFFFQCAAFYIIFSAVLIILDQIIFNHVLGGSFLYGLVLGLVATILFGWFMEVRVYHSSDV